LVYPDEKYSGLQIVPGKNKFDGGDDIPQDSHAFGQMVLAYLPHGYGQGGRVDIRDATCLGNQRL
jgi:hypothetical protein